MERRLFSPKSKRFEHTGLGRPTRFTTDSGAMLGTEASLSLSLSLTLFSPGDGWLILYTINPSICQLLMEILWGVGGKCQVAECHPGSLLPCIRGPV